MDSSSIGSSAARLLAGVSWQMLDAQEFTLAAGGHVDLGGDCISLVLVRSGLARLDTFENPLAAGALAVVVNAARFTAVESAILVQLSVGTGGSSLVAARLPGLVVLASFAELEPAVTGLIGTCPERSPHALDDLVCRHLTTTVMMTVFRTWLRCCEADANWPVGDPVVSRALAAMHDQPGRAWTVADLAAVAATSRSTFAARFTAAVGTSPLRYLTEVRMRLAGDLLLAGRTATGTARQAGYASEEGFSRAFQRYYGYSPAQWQAKRPSSRRAG